MARLKRASLFCLHKLWVTFAIGVMTLAVIVTVLRIGLPYATGYKTDIEQLIKAETGATVRIGALSAGWQGTGPALLLQQVAVQTEQQQSLLQVREARIRLDFWGSLTSLQLKADHFELSGLQVQFDSKYLLDQKPAAPEKDAEPLLLALENLLFRQLREFTLVDSHVTLTSEFTPPIDFEIRQLSWLNRDQRHQGRGDVAIAGVTGNTVSFVLDLHGETLAQSRGQLYLASHDLDILPWFETLVPQSQKLQRAAINFQAWGDIEQGALTQIQIALADNRLDWLRDNKPVSLRLGKGQLQWRPTEQGWQLLSSDLTLDSGKQQWHDLRLQLVRQQGIYTGSLQQLQLSAAQPLLELFAADNTGLQQLLAYQLDGRLTELGVRLDGNQWFLRGDFLDLQSAPVGDVPGVQGLSGNFSASHSFIRADVSGQDGELSWGDAFDRAMPYQQLQTRLQIIKQEQHWQVRVPQLTLRHPDIALDAQLLLDLGERPSMQLLGELRGVPVKDAKYYFPRYHMPKTVIDYLTPALVSGQVPSARVLWAGEFSEYPYSQHNGIFQALAQIENTEFRFDSSWPVIKNMHAELLFENASMLIQSHSGQLFEIELADGVTAAIPNLFQTDYLVIDISKHANAEQVTGLMLASPLSDSVGATLDFLGVRGDVDAKVQLNIGIGKDGVIAKGDVDFSNNQLAIRAPAVAVEQLQGRLSFVNEKIDSSQLNFIAAGVPMQAQLHGLQQQGHYQVSLQAQGEQPLEQLLTLVSPSLAKLGQGPVPYLWDLQISLPPTGFQYSSTMNLDLAAAELALPEPFGKQKTDGVGLQIDTKGDDIGSRIELRYGDQLAFSGHVNQATGAIDQALLSLGQSDAQLKDGFYIDAGLSSAELNDWLVLLVEQIRQWPSSDEQPALFPALSGVTARIERLHLFDDVNFHQAQLTLLPRDEHYELQLQADEVDGRLLIGKRLQQQGIQAELARLHLVFEDAAEQKLEEAAYKARLPHLKDSEKIDFAAQEAEAFAALEPMNWLAELPPLTLSCQQCRIGDYNLGQVTARSHSDGEQLYLDALEAQRDGHQWRAAGRWQKNDRIGTTYLAAKLVTPSFGQLMQDYDISSSMTGSKATIDLTQLSWQGAPTQFNRQTLSGKLAWELGEGTLAEVSDGGARVFSLLSLDTLLRKLRLDFRDVFAKGFFYSSMTGSMTITNGVSHTDNTQVDGAAGMIDMAGSADLKARKIKYQMDFSPKVTSSLPVIVAWMVNPVTGVAAYALDEMFQSAEVISKIQFDVTGDLDNPTVTEVKRDSKQIKVPADARKKAQQPAAEAKTPTGTPAVIPTVKPAVNAPAPAIDDFSTPSPVMKEAVIEDGAGISHGNTSGNSSDITPAKGDAAHE